MRTLTIGIRSIRVCSAEAAEYARPELTLSIQGILRHWQSILRCEAEEEAIHLDALACAIAARNGL